MDVQVTEIENFLSDSDVIISRTDTKGIITYASPDFARISEYAPEEMIGRPHNLIRHPDMPAPVFAHLWETIKAGMPWTGVVKNRAKSGNFYWVDATVTPIMLNDVITGYMSVRKKPEAEDVYKAERLYRQIRAGQRFKKSKPRLKRGFFRIVMGLLLLILPFFLISFHAFRHLNPILLIGLTSLQVVVFSALIFGIFRIYKNLSHSLQAAIDLASGDLRGLRRIPTETEGETKLLLLALKSLSISLWGIVTQIKKTVSEANKTAEILSFSSTRFSNSSGNLASSVEESAATMEELSGAIEQISNNVSTYSTTMSHMTMVIGSLNENLIHTMKSVENLGSLSREAADKATSGELMIRSLVDGMHGISESSEKIGEIVDIITDISEQTNLLALNASIEAARAGDSGRGFAVVAQEISKLSNQTAESVKRISDYIDSTALAVEQGADQVDNAAVEVRTILGMVNRINETAGSVYASVSGQSEQMATVREEIEALLPHGKEIDRAVSDHRHASHDVSKALSEISEQTQSVAEEAFHVSDISKQVKTHPAYLAGLIEHYRIEE